MQEIQYTKDRYNVFRNDYAKTKQMNSMAVPRLKYVTISVGCGKSHKDSSRLDYIADELTRIAGQKCVRTTAKKSISNFSLREGMTVGMKVTLRGVKMFEFIDRLNMIALPRMQDFNGLSLRSFDKQNNYNFGIKRQDIFVESNGNHLFGMNICLGILAKTKEDAINLIRGVGMPLHGGQR